MKDQNNKYSVLYIEDDQVLLGLYAKMLKQRFEHVYVAANGQEGCELYNKYAPDIVITDLRMPVMDGIEMIKYIRSENSKQKIIITSAHGDIDYTLSAIELNVDKYLLKPIKSSFLNQVIDEVKGQLRMERELEKYHNYIETIINTQPSIVMLNTKKDILIVNNSFLKFTCCESIEAFRNKYGAIQHLFEKAEGFFYVSDDSWLDEINDRQSNEKQTEVLIRNHIFSIYVNKVAHSREYVVTLADITLQKKFQEELQKRLDEAIETTRKQEQIIFQQKKLADLGRVINAIAHQWRQPLNNIGLHSQIFAGDVRADDFTEETVDNFEQSIMELVDSMSSTIDEFRLFYKHEEKIKEFDVISELIQLLKLINIQLSAQNITTKLTCQCQKKSYTCGDFMIQPECDYHKTLIKGYPGEFTQAVSNIIYNAADAIEEKFQSEPDLKGLINIDIYGADDVVTIKVTDNGAGIPQYIMGNIFDPYFSTKGEGKGTGIGLFMAKVVIEDHMKGRISAESTDNCTRFTIEIPVRN